MSIRINICFLPPEHIAQQALTVSGMFKTYNGLFQLNDTAHPHVTLHMSDFHNESVDEIISQVEDCVPLMKNISLRQEKYRQKKSGYCEVLFANTEAILAAQSLIASRVNHLRGSILAHTEVFETFTDEQKRNNVQWGYPEMGWLYEPHITFSRLPRGKAEVMQYIPTFDFSFVPTYMGVALVGEHGTCKEILRKVPI